MHCYVAVGAIMKWLICIREHHRTEVETLAQLMYGSDRRNINGMMETRRAQMSLKMLYFNW